MKVFCVLKIFLMVLSSLTVKAHKNHTNINVREIKSRRDNIDCRNCFVVNFSCNTFLSLFIVFENFPLSTCNDDLSGREGKKKTKKHE
jgi:hypothetical protein